MKIYMLSLSLLIFASITFAQTVKPPTKEEKRESEQRQKELTSSPTKPKRLWIGDS